MQVYSVMFEGLAAPVGVVIEYGKVTKAHPAVCDERAGKTLADVQAIVTAKKGEIHLTRAGKDGK